MSFLDKVARIRAELLGVPDDVPPPKVIATALSLMGVVPESSCSKVSNHFYVGHTSNFEERKIYYVLDDKKAGGSLKKEGSLSHHRGPDV